jgi:hypothetical protein
LSPTSPTPKALALLYRNPLFVVQWQKTLEVFMQKTLLALLLLSFACGGVGSSSQKRFAVEEGMSFAPSWGMNENKSRLLSSGSRPPQRTDAQALFDNAKPISGNVDGVLLLCLMKLPGIHKLDGYDSRVDPLLVFSAPDGAVLRYPSEFNVEQVFLTIPLLTLQSGTYKLQVYDQARLGDSEIVGSLRGEYTGSLPLIFQADGEKVSGLTAECRGMDAAAVGSLFDKESALLKERIPQVKGSLSLAPGEKVNAVGYNRALFALYDETQQLAALAGWQDARVKEHVAGVETVRRAWDALI